METAKPKLIHKKSDIAQDAILSRESEEISDIYFFGHSLDITDKDILRRFIISKKTRFMFLQEKEVRKVN